MSSVERPIVVVGAGVAGLACAYQLLTDGQGPVIVIERAPRVGGLAATQPWQGCLLDYGPHRVLSHYPEVDALERDLLGADLVVTPRRSAIYLRGRWLDYPGSPWQVARALGLGGGIRAISGFAAAKLAGRRAVGDDEAVSFRAYIEGMFGRGLYEAMFANFPLKVWGLPGEAIDKDAAKIRLASKSLWQTARDMLLRRAETYVAQVAYPRFGVGQIAERLAQRVAALGGRILLSHRVTSCAGTDRIDSLALVDNNGKSCSLAARALISSAPIGALVSFLAVEAETREAVRRLRVGPVQLVYILLSKERMTHNHWLYFPDKDVFFTRLYEPKNFSPDTAPPDQTAVCVETSCYGDWVCAPLTPAEAEERVVAGLEACGLIRRTDVAAVKVEHVADAYPVLEVGYAAALREVLTALARIPNCYTLGRQGLFSYNNMDLSIKMGLDLARMFSQGASPATWYRYAGETYGSYRIID